MVPPGSCSTRPLVGAAMPGGQKTKTLTVCNEGGSDLIYSVGEAQDQSATQVHTE